MRTARNLTVVLVAAALLASAPGPLTALATLTAAADPGDPFAPVVAALSLLAWVLTCWLLLVTLLLLGSRLPGLMGRTASTLARGVAPLAVRRGVAATLGLGLLLAGGTPALASGTADAGGAGAGAVRSTSPASSRAAWRDLDWPTPEPSEDAPAAAPTTAPPAPGSAPGSAPGTAPVTAPATSPATAPSTTVGTIETTYPADVVGRGDDDRPLHTVPGTVPLPTALIAPPRVSAAASPSVDPARSVVVRPGDSLWALAERAVSATGQPATAAAVAVAWPHWWSANREVIGADPDLLLPGTVLRAPEP